MIKGERTKSGEASTKRRFICGASCRINGGYLWQSYKMLLIGSGMKVPHLSRAMGKWVIFSSIWKSSAQSSMGRTRGNRDQLSTFPFCKNRTLHLTDPND